MRLIYFFIITLFAYLAPCFGAFEPLPVGGRSVAMGNALAGTTNGPECVFINPAGLSFLPGSAFHFYFTQPFGLKALRYEAFAMALPTSLGGFGLGVTAFGSRIYRETTVRIGWGHNYHRTMFYGFGVRLAHLSIEKYGSDFQCMIDAGCILNLSSRLTWGTIVSNINRARVSKTDESLPQVLRAGFGFRPDLPVLLVFELEKDVRYPLMMKGGFEYEPIRSMTLRMGFSREPSSFSGGLGFKVRRFCFDYAFASHPVLGITHQGSVTLFLGSFHLQ